MPWMSLLDSNGMGFVLGRGLYFGNWQHTLMTAHIDDAHNLFQWLADGVPIEPQRKVPASPILEHVHANEAFDETSASIDLHWRMSGSLGSR